MKRGGRKVGKKEKKSKKTEMEGGESRNTGKIEDEGMEEDRMTGTEEEEKERDREGKRRGRRRNAVQKFSHQL